MDRVVIIRYGEIFLKGKNKSYFESLLVNNIKSALKGYKHEFSRSQGRYVVSGYDIDSEYEIIDILKKVFGIYSLSVADRVETDYQNGFPNIKESLKALAISVGEQNTIANPTFRMTVKRADKRIPMRSCEIAALLADVVLTNTNFKVDLTNYDYDFLVDIRENGYAYIYNEVIHGAGGLPVGCSSKGLLLLSGGIDSPVAAYMMAKRGMKQVAVHFASPPYTSERATAKVVELRRVVAEALGKCYFHVARERSVRNVVNDERKRELCPADLVSGDRLKGAGKPRARRRLGTLRDALNDFRFALVYQHARRSVL